MTLTSRWCDSIGKSGGDPIFDVHPVSKLSEPILNLQLQSCTDSWLVDRIIEAWTHHKDENNQIAGDYYYNQFLSGVYFNKTIDIVFDHFPQELRLRLDEFNGIDEYKIIIRAIKELFASICGSAATLEAESTKRFHWRYVK